MRPITDEDRLTPGRVVAGARAKSLWASFRFAFQGIGHALGQRNMRIHVAIASAVVIVGLLFGLSAVEWAVLALTMGLVMSAELVNTAIEALVDLASPDYHPLAKIAKDVSAGAVVIAAMAAVAVGLVIFLPRIGLVIRR